MSALHQIYEEDLKDLERILPQLSALAIMSNAESNDGKVSPRIRTQVRSLKRILSDIRFGYNPPTELFIFDQKKVSEAESEEEAIDIIQQEMKRMEKMRKEQSEYVFGEKDNTEEPVPADHSEPQPEKIEELIQNEEEALEKLEEEIGNYMDNIFKQILGALPEEEVVDEDLEDDQEELEG